MKQFLLILQLKQAEKPHNTGSIQDYVYTSVACHYEYVIYLHSLADFHISTLITGL